MTSPIDYHSFMRSLAGFDVDRDSQVDIQDTHAAERASRRLGLFHHANGELPFLDPQRLEARSDDLLLAAFALDDRGAGTIASSFRAQARAQQVDLALGQLERWLDSQRDLDFLPFDNDRLQGIVEEIFPNATLIRVESGQIGAWRSDLERVLENPDAIRGQPSAIYELALLAIRSASWNPMTESELLSLASLVQSSLPAVDVSEDDYRSLRSELEEGVDFVALGEFHHDRGMGELGSRLLEDIEFSAIAFETQDEFQPRIDEVIQRYRAGEGESSPAGSSHWLRRELQRALSPPGSVHSTNILGRISPARESPSRDALFTLLVQAIETGVPVHFIDRRDPDDGLSRDAIMAERIAAMTADADGPVLGLFGLAHISNGQVALADPASMDMDEQSLVERTRAAGIRTVSVAFLLPGLDPFETPVSFDYEFP
ncbi:MAG: hypothetical protein AAFZ38_03020 [Myxococcota bacterium]